MVHSWLLFFVFGLASFRLTRLIVFDKITSFIRKPFHEEIEISDDEGNIDTYIKIKGTGLRSWIGELLSCYWCSGIWCTLILYGLWWFIPQAAEPLIIILAVAGLAGIIESIISMIIDK
ncbi:DUF1360 domain-containing protein [Heyndrickxia oleronia]|uniref:DUF1360 domain-containing protein n=1 Tax=Heyndrickxia oleronia TaxID=38875 RepID=UPI0037531646